MFEETGSMIVRSLFGLTFIIATLGIIWYLSKKNIGNIWQKFNNNEVIKISNFITLPNRSQLLHIDDQQFKKKYLLLVQSNGEVKVIDSKIHE